MSPSTLASSLRGILHLGKNASATSLLVCSQRGIAGKALRQKIDKPAPWPYEKKEFNLFWYLFDRTTLRFDENTKLVVVDGAHAVGKTKFAQELAEELDMLYMPHIDMDTYFKSPYGNIDLRDYNDYFLPKNKTYDEKDFARDPLGPVRGSMDRMLHKQYHLKFHQYVLALRHIFNTGQGVVLEKSPFSHHVLAKAAYNAGWVDKHSMKYYDLMYDYTLHYLLRPNLIIYLDAPADVVQKKIAARGNEWDKNSPVWSNSHYLNEIYTNMKRDYLKKAKGHSQVLVYDWSEPGETDVVVEDIERLNFDYYGQYEDHQKDWRLYNDEYCTMYRLRYSRLHELKQMWWNLERMPMDLDAVHMYLNSEERMNLEDVGRWFPGHRYAYGFNTDMGDKNIMLKWHYPTIVNAWRYQFNDWVTQPSWVNLHEVTPK